MSADVEIDSIHRTLSQVVKLTAANIQAFCHSAKFEAVKEIIECEDNNHLEAQVFVGQRHFNCALQQYNYARTITTQDFQYTAQFNSNCNIFQIGIA